MVPLVERGDILDEDVLKFLNRLSDFLFVAARTASKTLGKPESIWVKPRKPRADRGKAKEKPSDPAAASTAEQSEEVSGKE